MSMAKYLSQYRHLPTYQKIAKDAFIAGKEEGKAENATDRIKKLEKELRETKYLLKCREKELKDLESCIRDPEALTNLIGGL